MELTATSEKPSPDTDMLLSEAASVSGTGSVSKNRTMLYIVAALVFLILGGTIVYIFMSYSGIFYNGTCDLGIHETTAPDNVTPITKETDRSKENDDHEQIKWQVLELEEVGCSPKKNILRVESILSPDDALLDKNFYPRQVVLKLCSQLTSYCAGGKHCYPTKVTSKEIVFFYYDGEEQKFTKRIFDAHSECACW